MYSEHGFDALMRPVFGQVCQALTVVSYWMPGIAADPRGLGHLAHQVRGAVACPSACRCVTARVTPLAVRDHGAHELVGDAHGVVRVLEEDRIVGAAVDVELARVAGVDQRPGLLLFVGLASR